MPVNTKNSKLPSKVVSTHVDVALVDSKLVATKAPDTKAKKTSKNLTGANVVVPDVVPDVVLNVVPDVVLDVVVQANQKGAGKKKTPTKASTKASSKVEPTTLATEHNDTKVKATKVTKVPKVPKDTKTKDTNQKVEATKTKAVVKQSKTKKKKMETEVDEEGEDPEKSEKGVRSFKVQLPGNELFAGRFTGLTPYQAANKALSKYFRENKTIKSEIAFSIRESTRGSKRSTYNYNGKREKLETPVKYSINGLDGNVREIVKEYKNKLTKVKKSESKELSV